MSQTTMKTFTLQCPATNVDVGFLQLKVLHDVESLDERIHLEFGTSRLLCRDERERENHGDAVTAREALKTLAMALIPEESE